MDRSVIAYHDATDPEERKRYRQELKELAILSGLESAQERKQLQRPTDSPAFQKMMGAYLKAPFSGNKRAVVSRVCRKLLNKIVRPGLAAYYLANQPEDSDWLVLPVANFDAYFGTTSFGRKYLK